MSAEATVVRNYIDWILALPWYEQTKDKMDIKAAEDILEEDQGVDLTSADLETLPDWQRRQINQLARLMRDRQMELDRREAELNARMANFESQQRSAALAMDQPRFWIHIDYTLSRFKDERVRQAMELRAGQQAERGRCGRAHP